MEGRLRALATIEATSASVRQQAERYLARLSSPVRVSLFGRPSARKLMLLDVLASTDCVTEIDSAPTFELRWGDPATAQITTADGGVTEVSGQLEASHLTDAVLVVARRPSPILHRLSFIDNVYRTLHNNYDVSPEMAPNLARLRQ